MSDRSFVRFGGLAGILLAVTSWLSVVEYYTLVPAEQRLPLGVGRDVFAKSVSQSPFGLELFNAMLALIALWALIGLGAAYWRTRRAGEAWALFATMVGVVAGVGWIASAIYDVAQVQLAASYGQSGSAPIGEQVRYILDGPNPVNPHLVVTLGVTSIWFLVTALLLPAAGFPRLLQVLGFVAFADLAVGFLASLLGIGVLAIATQVIAGAVGGPLFWLWLGILLWRHPEPAAA